MEDTHFSTDSHKNVNEILEKRHNYFTIADSRFHNEVLEFRAKQTKKIEEKYGADGWKKYMDDWRKCLNEYLKNKNLDQMPESWSSSQPLPIANIVNVGFAGVGKSSCLASFINICPDMTVTSSVGDATQVFLDKAYHETPPGSLDHVNFEKTLFKLFRVKFSKEQIRIYIDQAMQNEELQQSYNDIKTNTSVLYSEEARLKLSREHLKLAARILWPLISTSFHDIVTEFTDLNAKAFRIEQLDTRAKNYQATLFLPAQYQRTQILKYLQEKGKRATKTHNKLAELSSIKNQEMYRSFISMYGHIKPPPAPAAFGIIVVEEDSKSHPIYLTIRSLLVVLITQLFNPPYIHYTVPIIISSGSKTQKGVINSNTSCLELCSSPLYLADTENTLAFTSEYFRRDIDIHQSPESHAHRLTCLTLERNIKQSPYTFLPLLSHEEYTNVSNSPVHAPSSVRLFRSHAEIRKFADQMKITGVATVPVTDIVYVADYLVKIDDKNIDSVPEDCLSTLTAAQAEKNRIKYWQAKEYLYNVDIVDGSFADDDVPESLHGLVPGDIKIQSDDLHDKALEAHMSKQHAMLLSKYTLIENNTSVDQAVSFAHKQSRRIGTHIPSLLNFDTETKANITFENNIDSACGQNVYNHIESDTKENRLPMFISGKATDLLSKHEHHYKRLYANEIAQKLGEGELLSEHVYKGAKVRGHTAKFQYFPEADLVIEYGKPNYKGGHIIKGRINSRTLYMAFKRTRYLVQDSSVTSESLHWKLRFIGCETTLAKLLTNQMFNSSTTIYFRCLIFSCIIEQYLAMKIQNESKDRIRELTYYSAIDIFDMYPIKTQNQMGECFLSVKNAYTLILKKVYVKHENTGFEHYHRQIDTIMQDLTRTINKIVVGEVNFTEKYNLKLAIDTCQLYKKFKYYHSEKFFNSSSTFSSTCNMTVIGSGTTLYNRHATEDLYKSEVQNRKLYTSTLISQTEKRARNMLRVMKSHEILTLSLESFCSSVYMQCLNVIKLDDTLVAVVLPALQNRVRWSRIFGDTYGLLMRRGFPVCNKTKFSDKIVNSMHYFFAESMNFPRPFRSLSYPQQSTIICKAKNGIIPYSKQPWNFTHTCKTKRFKKDNTNDEHNTVAISELSVFHTLMSPLFGSCVCTIASSQGSTFNHKIFVNFQNINTHERLVSLTRTTRTDHLKVCGIDRVLTESENCENEETHERYQIDTALCKFYKFR